MTVRRRSSEVEGGFTLVELMVALSLAAIMTLTIMIISNTARDIYTATTKKVELSNRFRLALLTLDRDFSLWIDTPNMEFYSDGRGAGARRNFQWDEGEQLPDKRDELGPGVVDSGLVGEYDEFASITQRHYYGVPAGVDPSDESNRKIHSAYQAYFRTMTYIDGILREANVEYMLVDPSKSDRYGNPQPPTLVRGEDMANLLLMKYVRYHRFNPDEIFQLTADLPITRRRVEVSSNVTDFKIEYTVENRFRQSIAMDFSTPKEDYEKPAERATQPQRGTDATGLPTYRKVFGYGSNDVNIQYEKGIAFKGRQGDRQLAGDHTPVRFGWDRNPNVQFAELVSGSKIFVFTEANRGIQVRGASQGLNRIVNFPSGLYTVKTNLAGRLEFFEDIDSTSWDGNQTPLFYKAAFVPAAIRITVRVVDDRAQNPKTLQRVVWIRSKAR